MSRGQKKTGSNLFAALRISKKKQTPDQNHHAQQGERTYPSDLNLTQSVSGGPDPRLISNQDDSTNVASGQCDRSQGLNSTQTRGTRSHQA